jgi:Na+/proline symporter
MQTALAIGLIVFFTLMVGISLLASRRIHSGEDFIVAGRGLSGLMTMATIMATWFAAETILVTADEIKIEGINIIVLEPLGIGICLILMGAIYARRLWRTKQMTLADVFRNSFGPIVEKIQALVAISYVGWVAVQLIGLAGVFNVFFGIPIPTAVILLTVVLTLYTLIGGMWSVAMTDIVQLTLLLLGVTVLTLKVLAELGAGPLSGLAALFDQLDARMLAMVPNESGESLRYWVGLMVAGVFANLATQDLVQRVFSARSADTAARSCVWAGVLYIVFGAMPVILGLSGALLLPAEMKDGVIAALAEQFLSPTMAVIFALTLTAAVTSSVDSGLLSPASVLAKNLFAPMLRDRISLISLTRLCIVVIATASAALAISGPRAFDIIQGTYAVSIPPFVLLTAALFQKDVRRLPAIITLGAGFGIWLFEILRNVFSGGSGGEVILPGFPAMLLVGSIILYTVTDWLVKRLT